MNSIIGLFFFEDRHGIVDNIDKGNLLSFYNFLNMCDKECLLHARSYCLISNKISNVSLNKLIKNDLFLFFLYNKNLYLKRSLIYINNSFMLLMNTRINYLIYMFKKYYMDQLLKNILIIKYGLWLI